MIKLGIIGCGNMGRFVMRNLGRDDFRDFSLQVIADVPAMEDCLKGLAAEYNCEYTTDPGTLVDRGLDVVLETAAPSAAKLYAPTLLRAGINMLCMSVGAFADGEFYREAERATEEGRSRLLLPTGGVAALDHLKTAQLVGLEEAVFTMTKPPKSLVGAPYFDQHPIDLFAIKEPTVVFEGTAADAIKAFPQNVNVAVAFSLASMGPDRTKFRLVCDPSATLVKMELYAKGPTSELKVEVVNPPSPDNPRTSTQSCLSALRTLKRFTDRIQLGT